MYIPRLQNIKTSENESTFGSLTSHRSNLQTAISNAKRSFLPIISPQELKTLW